MQIKIKAAVIDDEPLAREGIRDYLGKIDYVESVSVFSDPLKALKRIAAGEFNLLFLDIKMPEINGLDFLRTLEAPPLVIIVTAYPKYALEGFELDVSGYLVKPVSFEKFLKAVNKARSVLALKQAARAAVSGAANENYFFIKNNRSLEKINFSDILYIEAMQNYAAIHTAEKKHIAYGSMKSVYESLPEGRFIRIQKSFIVSISKIDSIEGNFIKIGQNRIPISRNKKEEIIKLITRGK
jgi:DNA-binding LytR/AlgR family response regulator